MTETTQERGWVFTVDESLQIAPYAEKPKTHAEWALMLEALSEPFPPDWVDFRPGNGEALAYIDARVVMDRLDAVVGPHNWSFDAEPIIVDGKNIVAVHGALTVHGVTKHDYGEQSNFHGNLGVFSHGLKRTAVHWGIGRYLYRVDGFPFQGKSIPEQVKRQLRAKLPKPKTASSAPAPLYATSEPAGETESAPATSSAPASSSAPATRPAPATPAAPALKLEDWTVAMWEAKARGVDTKPAWETMKATHGTLPAMAKYLATLDVVDTEASGKANAARESFRERTSKAAS